MMNWETMKEKIDWRSAALLLAGIVLGTLIARPWKRVNYYGFGNDSHFPAKTPDTEAD